jgi:hypothetical protein
MPLLPHRLDRHREVALLLALSGCEPDPERRVPDPSPEPGGLTNGAVVLNELVAYAGAPGDWIELYNPTDRVQDLTGATLWSVDQRLQSSWEFPPDTSIGPGEYLVVDCDEAPSRAGELHASFRLAREGGVVYFAYPTPDGGALESVAYPYLDHAWGRFEGEWVREPASSRGRPNGELVRSTLTGTVLPDGAVGAGLVVACVDTPEGPSSTFAFAEFTDLPAVGTCAALVVRDPTLPLEEPCFGAHLHDEVDGAVSAADLGQAPVDGVASSCFPPLPTRVVEDGAFQLELFTTCGPELSSTTVDAFLVFGPEE